MFTGFYEILQEIPSVTIRPRKIIKFSMLLSHLTNPGKKKPRVVLGLKILLDRQSKFKNNYHSPLWVLHAGGLRVFCSFEAFKSRLSNNSLQ